MPGTGAQNNVQKNKKKIITIEQKEVPISHTLLCFNFKTTLSQPSLTLCLINQLQTEMDSRYKKIDNLFPFRCAYIRASADACGDISL